jgi:hypothetical protein
MPDRCSTDQCHCYRRQHCCRQTDRATALRSFAALFSTGGGATRMNGALMSVGLGIANTVCVPVRGASSQTKEPSSSRKLFYQIQEGRLVNQVLDGQLGGGAVCCPAKDLLHKGRAYCNCAVYTTSTSKLQPRRDGMFCTPVWDGFRPVFDARLVQFWSLLIG